MHDLWERSPVLLSSWVFWVLLSVMLHELAHGWAALWQGDDTPRVTGHLNLNPLVHMGPTALLFFVLVGFTWGQMPVAPWRFRMGRMGDVLVSAAGPAMNLLLAFLALTALGVWLVKGPAGTPQYDNVQLFLSTGGWLNLFLACFNLMPFPPLDGSKMAAGLLPPVRRLIESPEAQQYGWFAILLAIVAGGFNTLQDFCMKQALLWADVVRSWLA